MMVSVDIAVKFRQIRFSIKCGRDRSDISTSRAKPFSLLLVITDFYLSFSPYFLIINTTMNPWNRFVLLLCFGLLISGLPLRPPSGSNHEIIATPQLRFDRRADPEQPDIPQPPKTPTPEDNPGFPVPGDSGVYHDKKTNYVWAMYGDNMREHAEHIKLNHERNPVNRMPMDLAGVREHEQNRKDALRGILTQPEKVRDEKPPALFKYPDSSVKPTVIMAPKGESSMFSLISKAS